MRVQSFILPAAALLFTLPAQAQSALGRSPNLRSDWSAPRGTTVFVFAHRFEFIQGGDQLFNIPTLTLGTSLARRLALGLDFTSNSEIIPTRLGGNETQYWLSGHLFERRGARLMGLVAYNSAARSIDGSLTGALRLGAISFLAEGRAFENSLATGDAGFAGALGALLHLTPHLELSADAGRLLSPDTLGTAWSAGIAVAIPGSPHTMSINASNGGALTLQSVSRPKVLGPRGTRWGFTFTVPLGSRRQWGRIFRRAEPPPERTDTGVVRVEMRNIDFAPREIRIRAGQRVEWVNRDPLVHTATADDGTWGSELLQEDDRYARAFAAPGRYSYHCAPHPQMRGVVIVEP